MAKKENEKKVTMLTRTLITGYKHDLYEKSEDGKIGNFVDTVEIPTKNMSDKKRKELCEQYGKDLFTAYAGTNETTYEMPLETFLQYATIKNN